MKRSATAPDESSDARATPRADRNAPPPSSALSIKVVLFVFIAIVTLQSARFDNGYTIDDRPLIDGEIISSWQNLPAIFSNNAMYAAGKAVDPGDELDTYRPLSITTFVWDRAISESTLVSYHVTNLVGHLLCTLLAMWLASRLVPSASATAILCAGLFVGLHPAGAEAHVWINGRSDVFMTLAGLLSLSCFFLWHVNPVRTFRSHSLLLGSGILALAACLFKETWVLLWPAYVVVALIASGGLHANARPARRRQIALTLLIPFSGLATYLALRMVVLHGLAAGGSENSFAAIRLLGPVWTESLFATFVPTRLAMRVLKADFAGMATFEYLWRAAIALAGVGVVVWHGLRNRRILPVVLGFGVLLASMAPIAMIATTEWPGFNRYLYVGIALMAPLVASLCTSMPSLRLQRALAGVVGLTFGIQTLSAVAIYQDMGTFASELVDDSPSVPLGWDLLGHHALDRQDFAEAVVLFRRAVLAGGTSCALLERKALAEVMNRDAQAATLTVEAGFAQCPHSATLLNVASLAAMNVDPAVAVEHAARCLERYPDFAPCRENIARWCSEHPLREQFRAAVAGAIANEELPRPSLRGLCAPPADR